jgi:hypothetical protein
VITGPEDTTDTSPWYKGTSGVRYAVRLSSTSTNVAYAIVESMAPPGCSPPMHIHRNHSQLITDRTVYVSC